MTEHVLNLSSGSSSIFVQNWHLPQVWRRISLRYPEEGQPFKSSQTSFTTCTSVLRNTLRKRKWRNSICGRNWNQRRNTSSVIQTDGKEQTLMREAADTEDGRSRFVTEGEASLHFCIQNGLTTEPNKVRLHMLFHTQNWTSDILGWQRHPNCRCWWWHHWH